MKKILIIGSSGQIGSFLASHLIDQKFKVLGSTRIRENETKNTLYLDPLKMEQEVLNHILEKNGITHVINCAGVKKVQDQKDVLTNAYLMNSLYQAKYAKKVVFINIASMAEYSMHTSDENTLIDENYVQCPKDLYGISKLLGTRLSLSYPNLNMVNLRVSSVIRQTMPNTTVLGALINAAKSPTNSVVEIDSSDNRRDFIDIRDLSALIEKIINSENLDKGIYNVGSGKTYTYSQLIQLFNDMCHKKGMKPPTVHFNHATKPLKFKRYTIDKIQHAINWTPTHNLKDSIGWCLSKKML
jgi:nucleoside-diphosphate-sugar epimerase